MPIGNVMFTVFSKPWTLPLPELAALVAKLGFDGVELPVRPGYQVPPENVSKGLKEAAKIFKDHGLKIGSVAGSTDEATIAACGEAGVPIIRICVGIDMKIGYLASEKAIQKGFDAVLPALKKHNVAIGVQNHCDYCVGSAIGVMHLIEKYDPRQVCAVLDFAHCSIAGEPSPMALDIAWTHVNGLVNFKAAFAERINGPEEIEARYGTHWTTSQHSAYSWSEMVGLLKQRGYAGQVCLPGEYHNPAGGQLMGDDVIRPLRQDIAYIKALWSGKTPAEAAMHATDWQSAHAHDRK